MNSQAANAAAGSSPSVSARRAVGDRMSTRSRSRRAFADAQDAGVLEDVLRCEVPILHVAGAREMPGTQARVAPAVNPDTARSRPNRSCTRA
jgi:hypothetical protein